jgi:malate dehydrogenase
MRDWFHGTASGRFVSMGVLSDGSYGAPKDVVFSFPVVIKKQEMGNCEGIAD